MRHVPDIVEQKITNAAYGIHTRIPRYPIYHSHKGMSFESKGIGRAGLINVARLSICKSLI